MNALSRVLSTCAVRKWLACNRNVPKSHLVVRALARLQAHPKTPIWEGLLCLELRLAKPLTSKDCTADMGYCMATDHGTGVSMSPQPPQDGRCTTFAPASYLIFIFYFAPPSKLEALWSLV